jgi:hypothetical protein
MTPTRLRPGQVVTIAAPWLAIHRCRATYFGMTEHRGKRLCLCILDSPSGPLLAPLPRARLRAGGEPGAVAWPRRRHRRQARP